MGPPLNDKVKELLNCDDTAALEEIRIYREYYRSRGIYENRLYDGVMELCRDLYGSGRKLILATSKAENFAVRVMQHFGLIKYFHFITGSSMDGSLSRKADVIRLSFERAGAIDLESAVMVGDRDFDIIGARQTGINSIGVLYGYGSREELESAGAGLLVETVGELRAVLLGC